ncbi:M23 family metallopeptidase [Coralloluteibacterium thermophilus]|uniref:M23 family metallopeptidase n=1 Tax=Coralloluteibacterium thermophilum TaxID=2707049 RepID=A0ABV9NLM2_9GAMM
MPFRPLLLALGLAALPGPSPAAGVGTRVALAPAPDAPAVARLRTVQRDGQFDVHVRNLTAGPIEIELGFAQAENMRSLPPLPLRQVLHAGEERLVAGLAAADGGRPARHRLALLAVPGTPDAAPVDVEYLRPFEGPVRIAQGWHGAFSHGTDEARYAIDFALPPGTPVRAARDGRVVQVESGFHEAGLDPALASRANIVRVLHDDGSMALYAHLAPDGIRVGPGDHVAAGSVLGLSGDTGYSSGPHLHFAVQVNRGLRLVSLPFRMRGFEVVEE